MVEITESLAVRQYKTGGGNGIGSRELMCFYLLDFKKAGHKITSNFGYYCQHVMS